MAYIIITGVVSLIVGFIIGYYFGSYFIKRLNATILQQNTYLQNYVDRFQNLALDMNALNKDISSHNVNQLSITMASVVQMLNVIQREQAHMMNNEQQSAISKIIDEAKSIDPSGEFD